ncbi:MAG: ChrR family anti-sigma-E factor [Candidatus Thiodiazotropha sp. (ex. Lucinisca nassula)]|nr:ChrR family anti-sigma-E factor [Candidatus Thiodiazotropha sp. (ex. Lucinisca nassula)]
MKINHHADDATIMAYAAGTVSEGFSLVLTAHMELCSHCRERMSLASDLGGELLSELESAPMSQEGLSNVLSAIDADTLDPVTPFKSPSVSGEMASILSAYVPHGLDEPPWQSLMPGVRQYQLAGIESGNGSVRLLSISPGIRIPHHTHMGGELTLVIEGAYEDEIGHFKAGDLADLDASCNHQPIAVGNKPCICLIATDDKLRFTGLLSRMVQPLIGI